MSRWIFACVSLMCAVAPAETLLCQVQHNGNEVMKSRVTLQPKSQQTLLEVEGYRFSIHHQGDHRFEIQLFDPIAPARLYASGSLEKTGQKLEHSLWSREILVSASCQLDEL